MTTDATEPEVIAGIRAAVFDEAALPSRIEQYKEILAAYDALTRERDALLLRCKEAEAGWLLAAPQRDDFAVSLVMARDGGK